MSRVAAVLLALCIAVPAWASGDYEQECPEIRMCYADQERYDSPISISVDWRDQWCRYKDVSIVPCEDCTNECVDPCPAVPQCPDCGECNGLNEEDITRIIEHCTPPAGCDAQRIACYAFLQAEHGIDCLKRPEKCRFNCKQSRGRYRTHCRKAFTGNPKGGDDPRCQNLGRAWVDDHVAGNDSIGGLGE